MAKKRSKAEDAKKPSFEEALERLEEIVRRLEEGEIGLNEALARYEEGVKLLRRCYDLLENVERRIEVLSGVDAEGNPVAVPMEEPPSGASGRRRGRSGSATGPSSPPSQGGATTRDSDMDASEGFS